MEMIQHHPDTAFLTDYAAGSLGFGRSLCVSVHLESCPECRARYEHLVDLGAHLVEKLAAAPVADDSLASVMARIDAQPARAQGRSQSPVQSRDGIPRPLARLLTQGYDGVTWQRVTAKLQTAVLPVGETRDQVSLVRIAPGGSIGQHRHAGSELTVILRGGFSDHTGVYEAGDFVCLGPEHTHQPVAHQNGECICLAAQDGPIQFTGLVARLLNPFLKIQPT